MFNKKLKQQLNEFESNLGIQLSNLEKRLSNLEMMYVREIPQDLIERLNQIPALETTALIHPHDLRIDFLEDRLDSLEREQREAARTYAHPRVLPSGEADLDE